MKKICTECGLEKPICEFVRNNTKKERKRNLIKQYINNIKQKGCSICGEKDIACLDFHHIDNKIKDVSGLIKK